MFNIYLFFAKEKFKNSITEKLINSLLYVLPIIMSRYKYIILCFLLFYQFEH